MSKLFKGFAVLLIAFLATVGCISLVSAADREVEVPVRMLDGTEETLIFTDVPSSVQIPICEQTSPNTLICAIVEGNQVRPLFITIEQESI